MEGIWKKKIIVAEDEVIIRTNMCRSLRRRGYEVVEAKNGQDAWGAIEQDPSISVVITDIEMPIMNGWKLLERIRGSVQFKDIPVLVITGSGTKEEVLAAGANAFMSKPIDEGFFTVVDELFSKAP